jgi:hypothetical protein
MITMKSFVTILCLFFLTALPAFCADFYVSTAGSDSNPGTQAQPFATIQHAIDMCPYTGGSSTVHLDGSTWNESPSITAQSNTGNNDRPNMKLIGDFNGPNGMGGRENSIINGKITAHSYVYSPFGEQTYVTLEKLKVNEIDISTLGAYGPMIAVNAHARVTDCNVIGSPNDGINASVLVADDVIIDDCLISNSTGCGVYVQYLSSGSNYTLSMITDCTITNNLGDGIYYRGPASYPFSYIFNQISNNTITGNFNGIKVENAAPRIADNQITGNQNYGVFIEAGTYFPDLGSNTGSPGNNTIAGNETYEVYNANPNLIYAKYNYWDPLSSAEMAGHTYLEIDVTRIYDHWEDSGLGYVDWDEPGIHTKVVPKSLGEIRASFYPPSNIIRQAKKR